MLSAEQMNGKDPHPPNTAHSASATSWGDDPQVPSTETGNHHDGKKSALLAFDPKGT